MQRRRLFSILLLVLMSALPPASLAQPAGYTGPIYDGSELDYQPSLLRVQEDGSLLMILERIVDLGTFSGDLYVTTSTDGGESWSLPKEAIASAENERHPALVQLGPGAFALFYLRSVGASYRIFRATSANGEVWTEAGMVNLGWATPGEINPCVIREADGSLTMTYHRLSGPAYLARSLDGGVTWDTLKTQVSPGNAQLPRLAKRESDGLYLVTYQVGGSNLDIYAKISADPYDWSGPQYSFSTAINSHDSQPIVLEDGTFFVPYAQQVGSVFDVYYRISPNGMSWSSEVRLTTDPAHYDTQPHPLLTGAPGHIILAWSHQVSDDPYEDHDVWINTDLLIPSDLSASSQSLAPALIIPGDALTCTLTLRNSGPGPAAAVLTDTLPLGAVYQPGSLWATSGDYGFDPAQGVITWTGMLSGSGEATVGFLLAADLDLADGTTITNVASLANLSMGETLTLTAAARVDAAPPATTITDPWPGQIISTTTYTVRGVAADTVSGVAQVMVSVDGSEWMAAAGLENWSFLWDLMADGEHSLYSRGVDALGQVESPTTGVTVTVDTTPPEVMAYSPITGTTDAPLTATLTITFSEPVITTTLELSVFPDPGGWTAAWNPAGTAATLSHAPFAPNQTYTVTLSGARDRAGHMLMPFEWVFTTVRRYWVFLPVIGKAVP